MKVNIDKYKMLYTEKEKCIYSIVLSVLLYFFILIMFNNVPYLKDAARMVIYLIGACTIILLCQSLLSIYEKSYYKIVSFIYTILAMFCMFKIIPIDLIHFKLLLILRNSFFLNTLYARVLALGFYEILDYMNINKKKIKGCILIIICNVDFILNYIGILNNVEGILFFTNILTLLMLYYESKNFKEFKFSIGSKINIISLLIYLDISIVILNLLSLIMLNIAGYIVLLREIIVFVVYIFLLFSIINKLINRPYRVLFTDLYKENLEMDILNGKVVKKNRELEFSQAIIRKKEKMFKTFFINVPIPLVIISKNGRIIFANSSFQKLIEEENIKNIINKKIFKIIDINDNSSNVEELINKNNKEINGVIKCKNNKKYVDIDIMEVSGEDNEALLILNDVTARVKIGKLRTDMENNKYQERIKSDFLSNISHDLKTPINVIYSAAQLVTMFIKKKDKKSLEKYNMICKQNCFGLIRLTNNLIDSSRIYSDYLSPNIQVKNIVEIIEEIVMSLIDYVKTKNIHLIFDTDEEEIYVKIDEEFMQRIMINLISNSIKFTNEGGKIEIIIHNEDKEVVINVKDNGVGMEEEFIENAFKRYAMGKNNDENNQKGNGIGLFVVKKLIEKQNGKINIKSTINKGTDVEMKFNKEI